jgi:RNA polymerase sigma-70 factor, ECF subfamily
MAQPALHFREVYDEHFAFVWRSLRRLGIREDDASDLVQEVFVVVHRKLCEFEGRSKITTWLFGICMRVARDHRQSAPVRREVATEATVLTEREDPTPDAGAELDRRRRRDLLERILDELPEDQRTVFVLFELEAMAGQEIAELLEIPTGTVHSRLRLAREGFRRAVARAEARGRFRAAEGL